MRGAAYCYDPSPDQCGPKLQVWVFQPRHLTEWVIPTLRFVEELYLENRLSLELYDRWLSLNSGKYQLGTNLELMELWRDRLDKSDLVNRDWTYSQLSAGLRLRLKQSYSRQKVGSEITDSDVDALLTSKHQAVRVVACGPSGHHARVYPGRVTQRLHLKVLNQLFPWTELEDKQKTNLDLASLAFVAIRRGLGETVNRALALMPVGQSNTVVTAWLVAALGNPEWQKVEALVRDDRRCCMTTAGYKAYFKAVSTAVRRTARWVDTGHLTVQQVSALAYFELSTGRSANLTHWPDEIAKRCGPELVLKNPYTGGDFLDELEPQIVAIVELMLPPRDKWGTWEEFVMDRQAWAPSGSAAGARAVIEGRDERINKHSFFEQTPRAEIMKWLASKPELAARGSEKMESGKSRAIFGTAPRDQTIVTYLIRPLEPGMARVKEFVNGHYGLQEVADIARRLAEVADGSVECSMLDYADFNIQHTLHAQRLLFAVVEKLVRRYDNADLHRAARWVREAQMCQTFKVPNDERWHKVTQGMFSGVRSTDFMNTILNLAYFNTVKQMVKNHTRLEPIGLFNLHKGDDVWVSNRSRLWAMELYRAMDEAGFVFQGSKQMFDRGRGEFLRVLYTAEGAMGYQMRAVATLLVKPIQSVIEQAPQSKATALTSQINLLYRRGLGEECCSILWDACVPRALRLKLPGGGGVGIPVGVAMKPFAMGGLDLGPPGTVGAGGMPSQPLPAPAAATEVLEAAIGREMSHDWIIRVAQKVKREFDAHALEASIHAANVSDSLRPQDRLQSMRNLERALKEWRDKLRIDGRMVQGRREALIIPDPTEGPELRVARRMEPVLWGMAMHGKGEAVIPQVVAVINRGIAQSPFRDLASAERALKGSVLSVARQCLLLAGGTSTSKSASAWLDYIEGELGTEVATKILQGIRGVGISYEAVLHPIVLSLVCQLATDCAVISAKASFIKNQYDWQSWLDGWMKNMVSATVGVWGCDKWSHY